VGTEIGYDSKIAVDAALLPNANYNVFRELVAKQSRVDSIMVVGHNPSMSEFLSRVVSSPSGKADVELKKGAIAKVELKGKQATLQWLMTPKMAKAIYESSTPKARPKTSRK
jgi:phosphohistidine phosphatase